MRGLNPLVNNPSTDRQPDGLIGSGAGRMLGNGRYDRTASTQTHPMAVARRTSKTCLVFVQNDGHFPDSIGVVCDAIGGNFKVLLYDGAFDVTNRAFAGTLKIRDLLPGQKHVLKAVIHARGRATVGEQRGVTIRMQSANDPNAQDSVRILATAK